MADGNIYVVPTIETDEDELSDLGMEYLQSQVPGWEPHGGNLDVWIIEAVAFMAARIAVMTADVPATIFRWFGTEVMGIFPADPTPSVGLSTWTVRPDNVAELNVIPDEWQVIINGQTFSVNERYEIPPGTSSISGVQLVALENGTSGSGLTDDPQLVNLLPWVQAIHMDGPTEGGSDGENDEDFLDKLSSLLRLMGPKLVRASEVEPFVRQIPLVHRALGLDLYDPTAGGGAGAWDIGKTITVAIADAAGEPLDSLTKDAVKELIKTSREVNFRIFIIDPTYNLIGVTYDAVCFAGSNPVEVKAQADAAIESYLSPAMWGSPNQGDGEVDKWVYTNKVRFGELYAVLNGVVGLDYVNSIAIQLGSNPPVTNTDVTLLGVAPLTRPKPDGIDGTVTLPGA